jgi:P27 family predicted phage terminase small subunit
MGLRGPKPMTKQQLKLHNSWKAKDCLDNPEPPVGEMIPPKYLADLARRCWRRIVKAMPDGVITDVDRLALERYCWAYAEWRDCVAYIAEYTDTYQAGETYRMHPKAKRANELMSQMDKLERAFGLNPADRTRIHVNPPKTDAQKKADKFKRA